MAFWRRAKARTAPINAGVPDFREALKDLSKIENQKDKKVVKETKRLKALVNVNSKREHETYSKMFIRSKA
jgi:hypothetical protein